MKVRKHIYFKGRVQGVGFRFQACRIAASLGVTGWVQNLWDGRVEMEAQAEPQVIQKLLVTLKKQPYIVIEDIDMEDIPPVEGEKSFHW